jgi:hypothetical protein
VQAGGGEPVGGRFREVLVDVDAADVLVDDEVGLPVGRSS